MLFKPDAKLFGTAGLDLGAVPEELVDAHLVSREPQVLTLNLTRSISPLSPEAACPDFEVVGVLQFGGGGAPYLCEIDMLEGVQLSVLASYVLFKAQVRSIPPGFPFQNYVVLPGGAHQNVPLVNVTATIGQGTMAHGTTPQRTLADNLSSIIGGAVVPAPLAYLGYRNYTVPAFAKHLRIYSEPLGSSLQVELICIAVPHATMQVVTSPSARIPLASDTQIINVMNIGSKPVTRLRLVFELAL